MKPIEWIKTETGCFECVSHSLNRGGYPQIRRLRRGTTLNRFIYEQCFGEIPEKMYVCHKCDNPKCINPEHLFLGTQQDNMKDMIQKGRGNRARGERSGKAKLTQDQVLSIREDYRTHLAIAKDYGVSRSLITLIKAHKVWIT